MHNAICKCLWYKYRNHVCVKQGVPVWLKLTASFCGGFNPARFYYFYYYHYYYYFSNTWDKSWGNSMNATHSEADVEGRVTKEP